MQATQIGRSLAVWSRSRLCCRVVCCVPRVEAVSALRAPHCRKRSSKAGLSPSVRGLSAVTASASASAAEGGAAGGMAGSHADLMKAFQACVPALSGANYKGQHGKVGILGGCREYTGAPFFAAMSASRVGADLMFVFCTESASIVIKTFSPDLIVMPLLPERPVFDDPPPEAEVSKMVDRSSALILPWMRKLSCLVVGPGMGDDPFVAAASRLVIKECRRANIPLVVDGSGINLIVAEPQLVKGYTNCVVTPNIAELGRIAGAVGVSLKGSIGSSWQQHAQEIAAALGGPVLISKGPADIITDGKAVLSCKVPATPKRCGGQGDVLAGIIATFVSWATRPGASRDLLVASYAACALLRTSSHTAFGKADRAMIASDVIAELQPTFLRVLSG
uniref:ATP-dependent (S)-NAD(P)H-hydrate dehydratase n=1 Tax=Chlamydomonas euryale TaxID=1486919 RepID=A0A7R9VTJ1_9CHLO